MLKSFVLRVVFKTSTLVTLISYPKIPSQYRFFIRYFFIHQLLQLKFLLKDKFIKSEYKFIDYNGEFGPELKFVVPFAYWHFKNGTLKQTISSKNTKEFYYFSENHQEKYCFRQWSNFNYDLNIPNSEDHNIKYNLHKWKQVPLKERYKNNELFKFVKPLLIIANKYNSEWNGEPVNFLTLEDIKFIHDNFNAKYTIIYNRPESSSIVNDNSKTYNLKDKEYIRKNLPKITLMEDIYEEYKEQVNNYNHLQLLVYSKSEKFISVQGGASVLASYFEGINIIYARKGIELFFNEFEAFYPKLSGAIIKHAKSKEQLRKYILSYIK